MFVRTAGAAAVGDTITVKITSAQTGDAGHNFTQTFTVSAAAETLALTGVDAGDFTASTVITVSAFITDSSGNVCATVTDTVTTAS